MENIVVGSPDCSITGVWIILSSSYIIKEKWSDFAGYLRITYKDIEKLRLDLLNEKINRNDALKSILHLWVADQGSNAKLAELIRVCEEECGDNSAGEKLRDANNLPCKEFQNDLASWAALSSSLKENVQKNVSKFCPPIRNGTECCSIYDVWVVLTKSDFIKDKWQEFAGYLRVPIEDIEDRRKCLVQNKIEESYVLIIILHIWVGHHGRNAQLVELIRVLEDECGDNSVGEKLRLLYNLPCKNFQNNWDTLPPAFQEKVEQKLSKFYPNISTDLVKSKLEGGILLDLMSGKMPKLFKSTIPPVPKFYLERTLLPRHNISVKIFEDDAPDIFLFTGLKEFELGRLVTKFETSTSGKQLDSSEINVRFVVLEQENHFKEICKRANHPIHLLSYDRESATLSWTKTNGHVNLLQRFVSDCQSPLTEGEFLEFLESKGIGPILISDSPGMGKTFLLVKIALELEKVERNVIFTPANDFFKKVKLNYGHNKSIMDSVKVTLQNIICKDELGNLELSNLLSATDVKIELLIDGFDEVSISDSSQALDTIKIIANSLKSIRLWITTRPHHLEEMEKNFTVLGYNIRGFCEEDQVNFLKLHWQNSEISRDKPDGNIKKLTDYGRSVLQTIKRQMNKDDKDIAGTPLQCLLIGEVFEEECIGFVSGSNHSTSQPKIRINSISDLFTNMVAKKFLKYISTHVSTEFVFDQLVVAHVDISLKLLFPTYIPNLEFNQVSMQDLLNIGIIQATGPTSTDFVHRTFAEYFVAGYVVDKLLEESESGEFASFFLEEILMRNKYIPQIITEMDGIQSYKFVHNVIGYFVNRNILSAEKLPKRLPTIKPIMRETKMEIYHACANSSFLQIFKLFLSKDYSTLDETLVLLTIRNSTCEYFKFVINCLGDSIASFEVENLSKFLRVAVQRSEPEIVDFLLKYKLFDFRELIENVNDSTKLVLHDCVSNTKYKLEDDIEMRVNVIKRLWEINPDLLEEIDDKRRTPLLCEYVHVDLLKELIKLGADINSQDVLGETVLHLSKNQSRRFNAHQYYSLLNTIPSKPKLIKALKVAANDKEIPFVRLLYYINLTKNTFDILSEDNAEFQGEQLLQAFLVAIVNGRNSQTLKYLIKLGVDLSWKGDGGSYLHFASFHGNVNGVKLLIEDYNFSPNMKDNKLQTPMDYVISSKERKLRFETAKVLYKFGGRATKQEDYLLNKAIKDGNAESIRIIQEILKIGDENLTASGISRIFSIHQSFELSEEEFQLRVKNFIMKNKTSRDSDGKSLLHLAVERRDELAINELVENGADLNDRDVLHNTPLHIASASTDLTIGMRIARFLINNGADALAENVNNFTFVHLLFPRRSRIISSQFHDLTEYLAEKKLLNLLTIPIGPEMRSPLHSACEQLDLEEKTLVLLKESGISFNQLDDFGHNTLICAILGGRSMKFINMLIKYGADWKLQGKYGVSGLHVAADCGRLEAMILLIGLGLDVNRVDTFGYTPLHRVANYGKKNALEIAKILVEAGVDVTRKDVYGHTALELFLKRPKDQFDNEICAEFVEILKIRGVDIATSNARDSATTSASLTNSAKQNKELLLHKAVIEIGDTSDCLNVLKSLIPTVVNVYAKDQEGNTFLHKLLRRKTLLPHHIHDISKYLIDIGYKVLFEEPGENGVNFLHLSVRYLEPKLETLQLLKSKGLNFNSLDFKGNTLLWHAINGERRVEFLSLLVNEIGVKWRRLNYQKQNLLYIAAQTSNEDALNFFVNLGLDINSRDIHGNTPIYHASRHGLDIQNFLQVLVGIGADINTKNNNGQTPLHALLYREEGDMSDAVKCLVQNGADINSIDSNGETPLYFAINHEMHSLPLINYLIDNGANVDSLNLKEISYLHLTARVGGVKVLKFFLDIKKLEVNAVDVDGDSPLHYAMKQGKIDFVLEKARLLVEFGADVNIKNRKGQKAIDIVNDRVDLVEELKRKLNELLTLR